MSSKKFFHDQVQVNRSKGPVSGEPKKNVFYVEEMDKQDFLDELTKMSKAEELSKENQLVVSVVDSETTGLDWDDEIIEVGITKIILDRRDLSFHSVVHLKSMLREPTKITKKTLTPLIENLTGLTTEVIKGHSIDFDELSKELAESSLLIAHNARFDRNMFVRHGVSDKLLWACTFDGIDWKELGFTLSQKQESLLLFHGVHFQGHRADSDTVSLAWLLIKFDYLKLLVKNLKARKGEVFVNTVGNTFHDKDALNAQGFRYFKNTSFNGNYKFMKEEDVEELKKAIPNVRFKVSKVTPNQFYADIGELV